MNPLLAEWDDELEGQDLEEKDPEEEYAALVRSLRWTEGFGMLFVQCAVPEGDRLIRRVRADLPQKTIEVLTLTESIDYLYDAIDALPNKDQINMLFIQGIEHSLLDYEREEQWENPADRYTYSWKNVPRLLGNLNLSRERFRDHFKFCIVFLIPLFALKYLIRRAPDFFDWRSGILHFPIAADRLQLESSQVTANLIEVEDYKNLTPPERRDKIIQIKALLDEPHQTPKRKASLYFDLGLLQAEAAQYEAAIASYEQALHYKPDKHEGWYNRGNALDELGRYEEAIASYEQALHFKPDKHNAWNNRGIALERLGRYEEAIGSYEQALHFKPDYPAAWYNKACCYGLQGKVEQAIESLQRAIELNPQYREMARTHTNFDRIREDERFQGLMEG